MDPRLRGRGGRGLVPVHERIADRASHFGHGIVYSIVTIKKFVSPCFR
jgi:hypothetical protein